MPRGQKPKFDHETELKIMAEYESGVGSTTVGKKYGVDKATVWNILRRHGRGASIRSKKEGHHKLALKEDSFDIDTEESLYWAGFIMADGCIHYPKSVNYNLQPMVIVSLAQRDREHLIKLKTFLGSDHVVRDKMSKCSNGSFSPSSRFSVVSRKLAEGLERFGVVPNKSKRSSAAEFACRSRHFWRGAVDGDGCIHYSLPRNKEGSGQGSIALDLLGTKSLCIQFAKYCYSLDQSIKAYLFHRKNYCWRISVNGFGAWKVLRELYYDSSAFLSRKKSKADHLVESFSSIKWRNMSADESRTANLVPR
jgi:hypothetical protein